MGRRGSALPAVLVVIILCVVGYFGWKAYEGYRKKKDAEQEAIRAKNRDTQARNDDKRRVKTDDKSEPETDAGGNSSDDDSAITAPEPPKKPEAEILREERDLWKDVWAQIRKARKSGPAEPRDESAAVKSDGADQPVAAAKPVESGTPSASRKAEQTEGKEAIRTVNEGIRGAETPDMPPGAPKKAEADVLREEEAHRKAVLAQREGALNKDDAKTLGSFAGIRFGEPIKSGTPVKWGTAFDELDGDSVSARGVAFAVYGPKLEKPFKSLGTTPLVWVTPQTRRPYRIEFSRPLAPGAETKHDPETTNLVAMIQSRFSVTPFIPRPSVPGRAGCEYVFPIGSATVMIGEYDGILRFAVQREDIREEARAETAALRQQLRVVSADGERLDSRRYPNGGVDPKKYRGLQFKEGTPPAFCGVVFGSQPPETATVVVSTNGAKGFFLDYRMAKCPPFRGFVYGRADIDPVRGGVYAIQLTSEGGAYGQDDKDYYETVRDSLSAHYKVKPIEKKGEDDFPNLIYQVGDVTILFGPDPRGGFRLYARNRVLAALAHTEPAAKPRKR